MASTAPLISSANEDATDPPAEALPRRMRAPTVVAAAACLSLVPPPPPTGPRPGPVPPSPVTPTVRYEPLHRPLSPPLRPISHDATRASRPADPADPAMHPPEKRPRPSPSPARFLLRSACGGALAEVIVNLALYPLDTLKVRTQYRHHLRPPLAHSPHHQPLSSRTLGSASSARGLQPRLRALNAPRHPNLSSATARLLGGRLRRAFAGAGAGVLASAFDAFVFTLVYEGVRLLHKRYINQISNGQNRRRHTHSAVLADFCAGAIASVASAAVDAPFALARDRIRLGLQPGLRAAWSDVAHSTGAGWRAVYVGAVPALVRDMPAEAIEFSAYDGLKRALFSRHQTQPGAAARVVLGAVAGALMGVVCAPLDLAVTRIVAKPAAYNKGVLGTLVKVAREEGGARATFRAMPHRACREAFSSALFFAIYDGLKGDADADADSETESRSPMPASSSVK